jgi:hypothetical protein
VLNNPAVLALRQLKLTATFCVTGRADAFKVLVDEDHVQRARYALCRGLSPDLLIGMMSCRKLPDFSLCDGP